MGHTPATFDGHFERNPFFTGRDDVIAKLHDVLSAGNRVGLRQAIRGMGGIGKTQTALEYAFRYRSEYERVFWTIADTHDALLSGFAAIAHELDLKQKNEANQTVVRDAVKHWLSTHTGWLLILDNADDVQMVRPFLPTANHSHVLLTSRAAAFGGLAQSVEIDKLSPEDGATFLLRRVGPIADNTDLNAASVEDRENALALSREVDGLPLALDQAGAYIEEMPSSLAEYLSLYQTRGKELRQQRGEFGELDHPSVTITFSLAFDKVKADNPAAADLLHLCAFLAPDDITEEMLVKGAEELGDVLGPAMSDDLTRVTAIHSACRYALLSRDVNAHALSVHRVVQDVIKDGLNTAERHTLAERAMQNVDLAYPDTDFHNWSSRERLLPHALVCCQWIETERILTIQAGHLLNQIGTYLSKHGQYAAAEPLYKSSLAIRKKIKGPGHPDTADSLSNLATLYVEQGRYAEAEPLYERSLAILEKSLEPKDFNIANSLNNLAALYVEQNRYAEAKPLYERSLAIVEKSLEPEHHLAATILNNLASVYSRLGNYVQAESLYQRSLLIREKALEAEHPDTARCLNNLAGLYIKQGRYAEAKPLYERSLAIRENALGPEHPDTANSLNGLAVLYGYQNRYAEAESLLKRSLAICKKSLGQLHPYTIAVMCSYANILRDMGKQGRAWMMQSETDRLKAELAKREAAS